MEVRLVGGPYDGMVFAMPVAWMPVIVARAPDFNPAMAMAESAMPEEITKGEYVSFSILIAGWFQYLADEDGLPLYRWTGWAE